MSGLREGSAQSSYRTLPNRPHKPIPHDEECECLACFTEVREREAAGRDHKRFIVCVRCEQRVVVTGHGDLKKRRLKAIERHRRLLPDCHHGRVHFRRDQPAKPKSPFAAQFFDKIDAASAKGAPIILSWEFAWGLRNELSAVAKWIKEGCPQGPEDFDKRNKA